MSGPFGVQSDLDFILCYIQRERSRGGLPVKLVEPAMDFVMEEWGMDGRE